MRKGRAMDFLNPRYGEMAYAVAAALKAVRYLAVAIAICCVSLSPIPSRAQAEGPEKFENIKVHAYTKALAKRFALPEPSMEIEPNGGLQAIEFSMEKTRGAEGFYWCVLKAYLDSNLPIAYPLNGNSGSRSLVELPEHFVFDNNVANQRWLSLSVEDRLHFGGQNTFGRRAAIVRLGSYWRDLLYDMFYRELFAGVSYIKFGEPCSTDVAGEGGGSAQLWIERFGGKDYGRIVRADPEDFLKLNLPLSFCRATLKLAKPANDYNRGLIERRNKR